MTASLKWGSKVFELLEGGAARARKAGRRKLNVFARWAIQIWIWRRISVQAWYRDQLLLTTAWERRSASRTFCCGFASNASHSCCARVLTNSR